MEVGEIPNTERPDILEGGSLAEILPSLDPPPSLALLHKCRVCSTLETTLSSIIFSISVGRCLHILDKLE